MRTLTQKLLGSVLLGSLLTLSMTPAQAHWGGGFRGGYHHHGGGGAWVAPAFIGGAFLGAALAAPSYSYAYPVAAPMPSYPVVPSYVAPVTPYAAPAAPAPSGYFCPTSRQDRKSTRLNSSHSQQSRMPSSA